jgi:hypothetical protein
MSVVSAEKRAKRAARKRVRPSSSKNSRDNGAEEVNAEGLIDDGADASFDPNAGRLGAPKRAKHGASSHSNNKRQQQQQQRGKGGGRSNKHVKEPEEAAEYLTEWRAKNEGEASVWRFNKATQSWLLRHMYKRDKVVKDTFKVRGEV